MGSHSKDSEAGRQSGDDCARETAPSLDALETDGVDSAERRRNVELAHSVNLGVQIFLADGRQMAESFLYCRQVPPHVVLRVLACAAFRRKLVTGRQS